MSYKNFGGGGSSGGSGSGTSTLTDDERSAEAKRILDRIGKQVRAALAADAPLPGVTDRAMGFLRQKLDDLELLGEVRLSEAQMYWLRDISAKVD